MPRRLGCRQVHGVSSSVLLVGGPTRRVDVRPTERGTCGKADLRRTAGCTPETHTCTAKTHHGDRRPAGRRSVDNSLPVHNQRSTRSARAWCVFGAPGSQPFPVGKPWDLARTVDAVGFDDVHVRARRLQSGRVPTRTCRSAPARCRLGRLDSTSVTDTAAAWAAARVQASPTRFRSNRRRLGWSAPRRGEPRTRSRKSS